jgi:hypothetical protein
MGNQSVRIINLTPQPLTFSYYHGGRIEVELWPAEVRIVDESEILFANTRISLTSQRDYSMPVGPWLLKYQAASRSKTEAQLTIQLR